MKDIEYFGTEAIRLTQSLQRLGHDPSGWDTFFKSVDSEEYWLLSYPNSSVHGGGVPRLSRSSLDAWLHNMSLAGSAA